MYELKIPPSAGFRPVGLRTHVRPDYYEWFPVLGDIELISRLHSLSFAEATLAIPRNVERSIELFSESANVRRDVEALACDLHGESWLSILRRLGFNPSIIDAFSRIPRSNFMLPRYHRLSWMNHHIWYDQGSCLSSLGLVALMANAVADKIISSVVEIGYGGGYQLALFSSLFLNSDSIGYESNIAVAELGKKNLLNSNDAGRYDLRTEVFTPDQWPQMPRTLVYGTCGMPNDFYSELESCLIPSQILLAPRMLTEAEYGSLSMDVGFLGLFKSYAYYQEVGNFLVLSLSEFRDGILVRDNLVYDIQMVPLETTIRTGSVEQGQSNEEWLVRLFSSDN
jgi:hypothetical protein